MKELRKRVSYLKGLMDGMELDVESKEGRILKEMIEIIEKMAASLEDLEEDYEDLEEYLESIDEDLYDLEDEIYDDDEEDDDEGESCIEVDCPKCQEVVCFDADVLDDEDVVEITCPNCDTVVFTNEKGEEKKIQAGQEEDMDD